MKLAILILTFQLVSVAHAGAKKKMTIDELEAKINRLQSTLEYIIRQNRSEKISIKNYDSCLDKCEKAFPWPNWIKDSSPAQDAAYEEDRKLRVSCVDECNKSKPIGYNSGC